MFKRAGLHSVWSRLAGTLAIVVVPTAVLILALAYSLYGATLQALETTETAAAIGRAGELRAWLDAAGRSLANESVAAGYLDGDRCRLLAEAFLQQNEGLAGAQFADADGNACRAGEAEHLDPPARSQTPAAGAYRFDIVHARLWIVANRANAATNSAPRNTLLIDRAALEARLRPDRTLGETELGLIDAQGDLATDSADVGWLPTTALTSVTSGRSFLRDRRGGNVAYFLAPIAPQQLYVLMRFDDRGVTAARHRIVVICAAQFAMLALLALVYLITVRRDVVRWVEAIDKAARAHGRDPESPVRAAVDPRMPTELRSVAESFNAMVDGAREHQRLMQTSLDDNRALMLEMHHRIKNSLQVIQSYLALIRRSGARAEAATLARIEARVGVLAVAYRLALTPEGMKPIDVGPFLDEIVSAAISSLRAPRQRIARGLAWNGALNVDRAIPLGLGTVEALVAALGAEGSTYVGVFVAECEKAGVELRIETDGEAPELPQKIVRGLAAQVGAVSPPGEKGVVLLWRFASREQEQSG